MNKYSIEVTEEQIRLIADCLEDVSRFAAGQCEMKWSIGEMLKDVPFDEKMEKRKGAEAVLKQAKRILLPELSTNENKGYDGTDFIGNTYQIYRTILHKLAIEHNWDNVYSSPPLKSGTMGTVKITKL